MKKFDFRLARVLDLRRMQVEIEETKLERLYSELRTLESRLNETRLEREQARCRLIAGGSVTGAELMALDHYRKASALECVRLSESATAQRGLIDAQLKAVIEKRRSVKLLEQLHARKLAAWHAELDREIDREAGELHLAKLHLARFASKRDQPVR